MHCDEPNQIFVRAMDHVPHKNSIYKYKAAYQIVDGAPVLQ